MENRPMKGLLPTEDGNAYRVEIRNGDQRIRIKRLGIIEKAIGDAVKAYFTKYKQRRLFEGPYQNAGIWAKETEKYVAEKGKKMKKLYFSYTTCPKCAKAYGKNYVVLFAQVE